MSFSILSVTLHYEHDTVTARQRARQIARLLGFDSQDQTRISTAVSEIARNAFTYAGGGRVEYLLEGRTAPQLFIVKIADAGPGIRDLETILEGRYHSSTGMGLGIIGARRLMDQFQIESNPGKGVTIWLKKLLPKRVPLIQAPDLAKIANALASETPQDAFQELQHQNQELLSALEEIRSRQGGAKPPEPGTGRHQSRGGRAVRRARRKGGSPAARRRIEIAIPLRHESRIPVAVELHHGAERPAA